MNECTNVFRLLEYNFLVSTLPINYDKSGQNQKKKKKKKNTENFLKETNKKPISANTLALPSSKLPNIALRLDGGPSQSQATQDPSQ